jgi:hypothetical protein
LEEQELSKDFPNRLLTTMFALGHLQGLLSFRGRRRKDFVEVPQVMTSVEHQGAPTGPVPIFVDVSRHLLMLDVHI